MIKYSYDLYNDLGRVQGSELMEKAYNETINRKDIKLVDEWNTEYKESTLYAKQYKINNYMLFVWKEVK